MKKIITIILVSLIINTNIIYAECTTEEQEYYKSIEDKYQTTYVFDKESRTYTMTLTYGDISAFSYSIEGDGMEIANIEVTDKIIVSNLAPGQYIAFVVGLTDSCNDVLKKEEITLPQYNQYAYDPVCEGIEEFVLCSPTYDKELDYDTFISRVNSYKKNKANQDKTDNNTEEKPTIKEWLKDNYMYFIYAIIGIVALLIIALIVKVIYNHERKRRRLE